MKILVLYAHPNTKSFNHAILETVVKVFHAKGHACVVRDLYGIRFDPVLMPADFEAVQRGAVRPDVEEEQRHVREADLIVFVHPIWWFSLPAILKGWLDRVLTFGFGYTITDKGAAGLLTGKKAAVFNTTGQPLEVYEAGYRTAIEQAFNKGTLAFCGIETIHHRFFHAVPAVSDPDRAAMLHQARADAEKLATA